MKTAQLQRLIEQAGASAPQQHETPARVLAGGSETAETTALIEARSAAGFR